MPSTSQESERAKIMEAAYRILATGDGATLSVAERNERSTVAGADLRELAQKDL